VVSPKFVPSVCESITEGVQEWRTRPLRAVWPVLCLDAFSSKLVTKDESESAALHVAVGVSLEGRKELLGLCLGQGEGAKFYLSLGMTASGLAVAPAKLARPKAIQARYQNIASRPKT
jgi:putative transposase